MRGKSAWFVLALAGASCSDAAVHMGDGAGGSSMSGPGPVASAGGGASTPAKSGTGTGKQGSAGTTGGTGATSPTNSGDNTTSGSGGSGGSEGTQEPIPEIPITAIPELAAAQVTSVPPSLVIQGQLYRYAPQHTLSGSVTWELLQAPEGMTVVDGSRIEWTAEGPGGATVLEPQAVVLRGTGQAPDGSGPITIDQQFTILVAQLVERASGNMDPEQLGQLLVTAPTSPIFGAGLTLPVGALDTETELSVSEVSIIPPFPNYEGALTAVDFGPSGLTFGVPATIALPFDNTPPVDVSRLGAYTFDAQTGSWEAVPIVSVDVDAGILYALATHFSVYAAARSAVSYELAAQVIPSGQCEGSLSVTGLLADGLGGLRIDSINNLPVELAPSSDFTVRELLELPGFFGSLRFVRSFEVTTEAGTPASQTLVSTVRVTPSFTTVVHTDATGNPLGTQVHLDLGAALDEIDASLSGQATHALFSTDLLPQDEGALTVNGSLHIVYSPEDQSWLGAPSSSLGAAAVTVSTTVPSPFASAPSDFDSDCDRLRPPFDTVDSSLLPHLEASPTALQPTPVGQVLDLAVLVADTTETPTGHTWTLRGGDVSLGIEQDEGDPGAVRVTPTAPGFYSLLFSVQVGSRTLEHRFNLQVLPVPAANTPPICRPGALRPTCETNTPASLFAFLGDRETDPNALHVEWGLVAQDDPDAALIPSEGLSVQSSREWLANYVATTAGIYTVGCRAFDGTDWGPVGRVNVDFVDPAVNLPPRDFVVFPGVVQVLQGQPAVYTPRATDPDGDALTFDWESSLPEQVVTVGTAGRLTIDTATIAPGDYDLFASVTDGQTPPLSLPAKLRVLGAPIARNDIDADGDGFPVSLDCNDNQRAINPSAREICGNNVDENCDGNVRVTDCDGDGAAAPEDCDDNNRAIRPGAFEECDGRDNDCDGTSDEGYNLEQACTVGLGVCTSIGIPVCAPDRLHVACRAQPMPSTAEVCDHLDNNCNGTVDEDQVCFREKLGIWMLCEDESCAQLAGEPIDLLPDGRFQVLRPVSGDQLFRIDQPWCVEVAGTFGASDQILMFQYTDESGISTERAAQVERLGSDRAHFTWRGAEESESGTQVRRRVPFLPNIGTCPDECTLDDDHDGVANCNDPCPRLPGTTCSAETCDPISGKCLIGPSQPCDPSTGLCPDCSIDADRDGIFDCEDRCPGDPRNICDAAGGGGVGACDATTGAGCPPEWCTFDQDADGLRNCEDACPLNPDPTCINACERDSDGDLIVDCEDRCPTDPDVACDPCLRDSDSDAVPDCEDRCPLDPANSCATGSAAACDPRTGLNCPPGWCDDDADADQVPNCEDACPFDRNPDCQDPCARDSDGDGLRDCEDRCPTIAGACDPCQFDVDVDGVPDCEDPCPSTPGVQCGSPPPPASICDARTGLNCPADWCTQDADRDEVVNCEDVCPFDPNLDCQDPCEQDSDADGTVDCRDHCPTVPDPDCDPCLQDADTDGMADCADPCPGDAQNQCAAGAGGAATAPCNSTTGENCPPGWCDSDEDGDTTINCQDACPFDPNPDCVHPCALDTDSDGIADCEDRCPLDPNLDCDPCQLDLDVDGLPDCEDPCPNLPGVACGVGPTPVAACDARTGINCPPGWCTDDADQDEFVNCEDPCPFDPNLDCQDPCEQDNDGDGLVDCQDRCPTVPDPDCDPCLQDTDADGMADCEDPCPGDGQNQCSTSSGGSASAPCNSMTGENCPPGWCEGDEDGDTTINCQDACPFDPAPDCVHPCALDADQDGVADCQDICPLDPNLDCDPCTQDLDNDGLGDCEDPCPTSADQACEPILVIDPPPPAPLPTCDEVTGDNCPSDWCPLDGDTDGLLNCDDPCPADPNVACTSPI